MNEKKKYDEKRYKAICHGARVTDDFPVEDWTKAKVSLFAP